MKSIFLILLSFLCTFLHAGEFADKTLYQNQSVWLGFNPKDMNEKIVLCQIHSNGAHDPMIFKEKIYFEEGSSTITIKELNKIKKLLTSHPENIESIRLTAFTDKCGDEKENLSLSKQRAETVLEKINQLILTKVEISGTFFGESKSHKHSEHDRHVEIIVRGKNLNSKIENVYIIDGSGSFVDRRSLKGFSFEQIKKLNFTPGTLVYVVREAAIGCPSTNLSDYYPEGGTFVKQAQGVIASQVKGHMNIITYTDEPEVFTPEESRIFSEIMRKTRAQGNSIRWYYQ